MLLELGTFWTGTDCQCAVRLSYQYCGFALYWYESIGTVQTEARWIREVGQSFPQRTCQRAECTGWLGKFAAL